MNPTSTELCIITAQNLKSLKYRAQLIISSDGALQSTYDEFVQSGLTEDQAMGAVLGHAWKTIAGMEVGKSS